MVRRCALSAGGSPHRSPAHPLTLSLILTGKQVFRICDELVDDVLLVDEIDISSAVADVFLDTRAVLEPNGAIALAGLKQFAAKKQSANNDANASLRRPSYIAIGSDASNVEFSSLQRVAQEGQQC